MAALAYVLLPISGLIAYLKGSSQRMRFHGLQAIFIGLVWPLALYACTYLSPGVTQACFAVGGAVWLTFLATAAFGADPRIPLVGAGLSRAARGDPRAPAGAGKEEAG